MGKGSQPHPPAEEARYERSCIDMETARFPARRLDSVLIWGISSVLMNVNRL